MKMMIKEIIEKISKRIDYKMNTEITETSISFNYLDSIDLNSILNILNEFNNSVELRHQIFFNIRCRNDKFILNFI